MDKEIRADALTYMYRKDANGELEAKIFKHPDDIPTGEGWVNSPTRINDIPSVQDVDPIQAVDPIADVPPVPPVAAPGTPTPTDGTDAPEPVAEVPVAAPEPAPAPAPAKAPTKNSLLSSGKTVKNKG